MGTDQHKLTYNANRQHSSPAIIDIMVSLRPKIYAILTLLRYRHNERVEIVEQKYRITFLPMPARDQVRKRRNSESKLHPPQFYLYETKPNAINFLV